MPSADFCMFTPQVSLPGADGSHHKTLSVSSLPFYSRLASADIGKRMRQAFDHRGTNPGHLLMMLHPHGMQISPDVSPLIWEDKNVNFSCTTAAFTLSPEPVGFVMLCKLARGLSLICDFCSSARTFASGFLRTVGHPPALAFS